MSLTGFQRVFQPLWAAETRATEWLWPWTAAAPENPTPAALLTGDGGGSAVLTEQPTPGGSWVRALPEGVVMHLSPADAASIKGRDVLMGLWLTFLRQSDGERLSSMSSVIRVPAAGNPLSMRCQRAAGSPNPPRSGARKRPARLRPSALPCQAPRWRVPDSDHPEGLQCTPVPDAGRCAR